MLKGITVDTVDGIAIVKNVENITTTSAIIVERILIRTEVNWINLNVE